MGASPGSRITREDEDHGRSLGSLVARETFVWWICLFVEIYVCLPSWAKAEGKEGPLWARVIA